jgi:hypothetical protein
MQQHKWAAAHNMHRRTQMCTAQEPDQAGQQRAPCTAARCTAWARVDSVAVIDWDRVDGADVVLVQPHDCCACDGQHTQEDCHAHLCFGGGVREVQKTKPGSSSTATAAAQSTSVSSSKIVSGAAQAAAEGGSEVRVLLGAHAYRC